LATATQRLPSASFLKARRAYRSASLRSVGKQRKGTLWSKHSDCLFREIGPYFVIVTIQISEWQSQTRIVATAKPSSLDDIFWRLFGIPDNSKGPRSLKAVGTFAPRLPELLFAAWSDAEFLPDENAKRLLKESDRLGEEAARELIGNSFADFLRVRDEQSGSDYSMTLVAALELEGRTKEAQALARDYASGRRRSRLVFSDKSGETFFSLSAKRLSGQLPRGPLN